MMAFSASFGLFGRASIILKNFSSGGHVATETVAPASASALAIENPNPRSSPTPATSADFPVRSMASIGGMIASPRAALAPARCDRDRHFDDDRPGCDRRAVSR